MEGYIERVIVLAIAMNKYVVRLISRRISCTVLGFFFFFFYNDGWSPQGVFKEARPTILLLHEHS